MGKGNEMKKAVCMMLHLFWFTAPVHGLLVTIDCLWSITTQASMSSGMADSTVKSFIPTIVPASGALFPLEKIWID